MSTWSQNTQLFSQCLNQLIIWNSKQEILEADRAFEQLKTITFNLRKDGQRIYLVGNGASASMASHIAADLGKNARIYTEVFTDLSLITAVSNDISYDKSFSEPLSWRMQPGDMLVAISSSGNSPNAVNAVKVANKKGGFTVTLSAMQTDNSLRKSGALNFWIPADTYGMAETSHAAILHYWVDLVVG